MTKNETLPVEKVDPWLKAQVPGLTGAPKVTQYSGGASNWTYRLEYENADLVLRRPPEGTKAKSAHDMGREFRIQKALKPAFAFVPEMVALCSDEAVLGCEFYVMRRLDGLIPRKNLGFELSAEKTRQLCLNVIDTFVALHRVDAKSVGLDALGKGEGYVQRQIDGWTDRYAKARTWNVPRWSRITSWLKANAPKDSAQCVIHNDFRFDNVVLDKADPTRVIGVLDWELATIGDPLMDLGSSLAYWVEAGDDWFGQRIRRQPTHLPGMLTRKELIAHYAKTMGIAVPDFTFYEVYGLFRLAGIAQQIYYRYHHKQTRNPAFKQFWLFVHYLHWRAKRVLR